MVDTRISHGITCYCEECCDSASDWYTWRSPDLDKASGSRYWTVWDALGDRALAKSDGLTRLVHEPDGIELREWCQSHHRSL